MKKTNLTLASFLVFGVVACAPTNSKYSPVENKISDVVSQREERERAARRSELQTTFPEVYVANIHAKSTQLQQRIKAVDAEMSVASANSQDSIQIRMVVLAAGEDASKNAEVEFTASLTGGTNQAVRSDVLESTNFKELNLSAQFHVSADRRRLLAVVMTGDANSRQVVGLIFDRVKSSVEAADAQTATGFRLIFQDGTAQPKSITAANVDAVKAAADDAAKKAAEAKKAADEEAARKAAEDDAAKKAAEQAEAKKQAEEAAAKKQAEEAAAKAQAEELAKRQAGREEAIKKATEESAAYEKGYTNDHKAGGRR
jgi:hypothetical protein